MGLTVVAAGLDDHASADLDASEPRRHRLPDARLLLRLMDDPHYEGRLFLDISGVESNPRGLGRILQRPDLWGRLVNGSGYPFLVKSVLNSLNPLVKNGFLTRKQARLLREIYGFNPLLFDVTLKRTVHLPGTDIHLPGKVFTATLPPGGKS
jgi:hypothetical protein